MQFSELIAARMAGRTIRAETLYIADFLSAPFRAWTGATPVVIEGYEYIAAGAALNHSVLSLAGSAARSFSITLSGLPVDQWDLYTSMMITDAREYRGRTVIVALQLLDDAGALLDSPIMLQRGVMDAPEFTDSGDRRTITIHCESAFVSRRRPRYSTYTDADQQRRSPGDRGFEYGPSSAAKNIKHPVLPPS